MKCVLFDGDFADLKLYSMLGLAWRTPRLHTIVLRRHTSCGAKKQHEPLRILFCGSDEFSIYSLRALRKLQGSKPNKIASIDVLCRPDKRVGRGLKQVQEGQQRCYLRTTETGRSNSQTVPIKSVSAQLGLKLHQKDTFKGWSLPTSINLVIAVSFGLLVPARILNEAKYGGLNVHPSLLPDLRGPAPIIHTLLKQRSHTGVTLQDYASNPVRSRDCACSNDFSGSKCAAK